MAERARGRWADNGPEQHSAQGPLLTKHLPPDQASGKPSTKPEWLDGTSLLGQQKGGLVPSTKHWEIPEPTQHYPGQRGQSTYKSLLGSD